MPSSLEKKMLVENGVHRKSLSSRGAWKYGIRSNVIQREEGGGKGKKGFR